MIKDFFATTKTALKQPETAKIKSGQLLVSRLPVYQSADKSSMQVSQLLYGEQYDVYETEEITEPNWYLIQSQRDHYVGYIHVDEITPPHFISNAKVSQLSTVLYAQPNMKSQALYELPLGAEIDVITETDTLSLQCETEHVDYYFSPSLAAWVFKKHLLLHLTFTLTINY